MPGLAGFTCEGLSPEDARAALARMRGLLSHGRSQHQDQLFCDGHVCTTRTHTNILQKEPQPAERDGIRVWLDGEFYNREELARTLDPVASPGEQSSDPALLLSLYRRDDGFDFLKDIDGVFAAVVYDARRRRLFIVTDRHGLRHISWTRWRDGIAWCSEVKAVLALPSFEPKIDRAALVDFMEMGHLLGDRTWFEGVELLPAATVLTWKIDERTLERQRYWSPNEIEPLSESADAVEVAEELGRRFRRAVERRSLAGERVGLKLSGGLDSRAILAAMPERGAPLHAVTFGKKGCEDAKIAAIAAARKGAEHHTCEMDAGGWLGPRFDGVWWTDGEFDLMHMHVVSILPRVAELFDIGLDGCGANGIIGDSWADHGLAGPAEYIDGRTRRFLVFGPAVVRGFIEERFPFFDNEFIELALAAPARWKTGNALYRMMLLKTFPDFFESIPWQKTGAPITWPRDGEKPRKRLVEIRDQLLYKLSWYGITDPPARGYADYAKWVRQEPARTVFSEMLGDRDALYAEFVPHNWIEAELKKHLAGRERSEYLCRVLTLEIWLRQVFRGEHRQAPEEAGEAWASASKTSNMKL